MLDRIDIHVDVPQVLASKIVSDDENLTESSARIRKRVIGARKRQERRFKDKKIVTNSEMTSRQLKEFAKIEEDARSVLKEALIRLSLSARSYHKVIKIAQTIADLQNSNSIQREHVLEALQYRPRMVNRE